MKDDQLAGLNLMRESFPENQIGKLPKGSKTQMTCDAKEKVNCKVCGGWHHPKLIHLDFVGHAALTDRLLNCDMNWTWEPLAFDEKGLPAFDTDGGLWIRMTVCGVARLGYGNAAASQYKEIGSRQKEVIGDALRNASMRFGAALELWHKGDLHVDEEKPAVKEYYEDEPPTPKKITKSDFQAKIDAKTTLQEVEEWERCHLGKAESMLSAPDYEWFTRYIADHKTTMAE